MPYSFFGFGLTLLSYHGAEAVTLVILLFLIGLYAKELWRIKKIFFISFSIFLLFIILMILNPALSGIARIQQTSFSDQELQETEIFHKIHSKLLARIEIGLKQYPLHFTPRYLFISGDKNPRLSAEYAGEFYKVDAFFLITGLIGLLFKRSRISLLLLFWALIAPLPSSFTKEAPHAGRAMFMLGSWNLIAAYGVFWMLSFIKKKYFRFLFIMTILLIYGFFLQQFLSNYFQDYSKKYAHDWQYGMKEIVEYVKGHPEYSQIFMTNIRAQPYIFFLYYLKTPLPEFLETVEYNHGESASYSQIIFFGKYLFEGWDPYTITPLPGRLYVIGPSHYDGLYHKSEFKVKKIIYYPDGREAFYLISDSKLR